MGLTTANQALPYPVGTDAPNGPQQLLDLALVVEKQLVMRFASTADRTAKVASPVEGMLCWLSDVNRLEVYTGSSWVEVTQVAAVSALIAAAFAPKYAMFRQTTLQSVSASTWTAITITTEDFDIDNGHSTSSNTARYTAQTAGDYLCFGKVAWAAFSTGTASARFTKNGTVINGSGGRRDNPGFICTIHCHPTIVTLGVGDYVDLQGLQSSASSQNTDVGTEAQSAMTVWRIAA